MFSISFWHFSTKKRLALVENSFLRVVPFEKEGEMKRG